MNRPVLACCIMLSMFVFTCLVGGVVLTDRTPRLLRVTDCTVDIDAGKQMLANIASKRITKAIMDRNCYKEQIAETDEHVQLIIGHEECTAATLDEACDKIVKGIMAAKYQTQSTWVIPLPGYSEDYRSNVGGIQCAMYGGWGGHYFLSCAVVLYWSSSPLASK